MIAVDTSALMAIVLNEPDADRIQGRLEQADGFLMSAGTLVEALIVSARRNRADAMLRLIASLDAEIAPVTEDTARRVADAYRRWGKGVHPASLNLGDCFAYEIAQNRGCALLYIGSDFLKTDIVPAL